MSPRVVLHFHVHQPRRLASVASVDISKKKEIFDYDLDKEIISRVAQNCYFPANHLLTRLVDKYPGVKLCFSLSGTLIDQLEEYQPRVLTDFRNLAQSGSVEFLGETYYHSLSSVVPNNEFIAQVQEHSALMEHHLGYRPSVFRNTDLIYSTSIGSKIAQLGFKGVICDGAAEIVGDANPQQVYKLPTNPNCSILFRNNSLSDDITVRFTEGGRLDLEQYLQKIYGVPGDSVVVIGVDYELFGEHYPNSSGILDFLEKLIVSLHNDWEVKLATPSEVIQANTLSETFDVHGIVSWANDSHNISRWLGNEMQCDAFKTLNDLEEKVMATQNKSIIKTWRNLQSSDHFYYMSTKFSGKGEAAPLFSPYGSPYDAFINYMNVLADFSSRLNDSQPVKENNIIESERRHEDVPVWAQQYASYVANTIG